MIKLSKIPEAIISCFSFIGIEKSILKRVGANNADEFGRKMAANIDGMFAEHSNHLLAGRLLDAAIERWPSEVFLELYTPVRKNIEMPLCPDGRLVTGETTTWLAPLRLSRESVEKAFNSVLRITVRRFYKFVLIALAIGVAGGFGTYVTTSSIYVSSTRDSQYEYSSYEYSNPRAQPRANKITVSAFSSVAALLAAGGLFAGSLGIAYAFALRRALSPRSIRGAVQSIIESDEVLTAKTSESIVRYKFRYSERNNHQTAYRQQILMSNYDKSPRIRLGRGTGTAVFKGALNGYMPNQEVSISFQDLTQNCFIQGLTGSGKSYAVFMPIIEGIMRVMRDTPRAERTSISLLLLDGKVVLIHDAKKLSEKFGSTLRVIGCNPGDWGCDLFNGLAPHLVGSIMSEADSQVSANSDADFWKGGANDIFIKAAILARAYEVTPEGIAEMKRTRERIYSPVGVYKIAYGCREAGPGLLHDVVKAIIAAARSSDPEVRNGILPFMGSDLFEAITYLRTKTPKIPDGVIGSFMEHIRAILSDFTTLDPMRKNFGTASGEKMLDIDSCFDDNTITCTSLSPAEWGKFAMLAIKIVKLRIYHRSKQRNQADPDIAMKSRLFVGIDEFQQLVTLGEFGEAEFLNVSRSTGTSFILATQSEAACSAKLNEMMGGSVVANLMQQLRQKIVVSAEGEISYKFIQGLSGTATRCYIAEDGKYETYAAARMERGQSLNLIDPFEYTEKEMDEMVLRGKNPEHIEVLTKPLFEVDRRFIPEQRGGLSAEAAAQNAKEIQSAIKEAVWRRDDKERSSLLEGNVEKPIYDQNDLASLGQGKAWVSLNINGKTMTDIIILDGPGRGKTLTYDTSLMPKQVLEARDRAALNKKRKQSAEIVEAMEA